MSELTGKYAEYAIEYYVAARYSALAASFHVSGILYHHAIEMLLKARLSEKYDTQQLKKWGHDVEALWTVYLKERGNDGLKKFDSAIQRLNAWEKIRYPETLVKTGALITFAVPNAPGPQPQGNPKAAVEPRFHFSIQELDALMVELFASSSMNPEPLFPLWRYETEKSFHLFNESFPKKTTK
jgi:hypothetical protein